MDLNLNMEPIGKLYSNFNLQKYEIVQNFHISNLSVGVMNNNSIAAHHVTASPPAKIVVEREPREGGGSKAQQCPHCHREFTNLRHHINQQHMQVGPAGNLSITTFNYDFVILSFLI